MKRVLLLLSLLFTLANAQPVLISIHNAKFDQIYSKLLQTVRAKKLTLFCTIDHAQNANRVSKSLPPTVLILFGNPAMGTKLIQKDPILGLYLPLHILLYKQENKIFIAYDTTALAQILDNQTVAKIEKLYESIIDETVH